MKETGGKRNIIMHSPITDKSCKVAAKVTISPVVTTKFILHSDAKVKLILCAMLCFFKVLF